MFFPRLRFFSFRLAYGFSSFSVFRKSETHTVVLLWGIFFFCSVLSFKNCFRSLERFMISFDRFLFINGIWLSCTYFCFRCTCRSKVVLLISTPLPQKKIKIKKIAVKNGSDGWREICIWTVNFKELQEVDFHSIKGLE